MFVSVAPFPLSGGLSKSLQRGIPGRRFRGKRGLSHTVGTGRGVGRQKMTYGWAVFAGVMTYGWGSVCRGVKGGACTSMRVPPYANAPLRGLL